MTLSITFDDLMNFEPCYDSKNLERVRVVASQRERWTALDILDAEEFPPKDRLWLVLREELIPAKALRLLACDFAERALVREREAGREPDERCWKAIEVSRRFANGEATHEELAAAEAAARAAALAAALAAVDAAAWVAAQAGAVALAAAAARAEARASERQWQVEHIRAVLVRNH